jgi:hypothetical protein
MPRSAGNGWRAEAGFAFVAGGQPALAKRPVVPGNVDADFRMLLRCPGVPRGHELYRERMKSSGRSYND